MKSSKYEKYLVRKPVYEVMSGIKNRQCPTMTFMSRTQVPEANHYLEYGWIYGIPEPNPHIPEHAHDFDEIVLYIGGDPQNPEDLGGEIEFYFGGQLFTLSTGTGIFIPAGFSHGPVTWKRFKKPHIEMEIMLNVGSLEGIKPRDDKKEPEKRLPQKAKNVNYEKYLVRKPIYERARGVKNRQSPTMTFMSTAQVPEANYYIEYGWIYGIPEPNPPVTEHVHSNDEIVLHFGGDSQNPEDLGGEIEVKVEGEPLLFDTSTALYAPKGVKHCPVTWKKWRKPHIEMAITLGSGKR